MKGAELAHKDWVWGVAFSPDSRMALTSSKDGTAQRWDALWEGAGNVMFGRRLSVSPNGLQLIVCKDNDIHIFWRRPPPGTYDPWAEDLQRRTALAPSWDVEDLEAARQRGDSFAVEFHRRWLSQGDSLCTLAWNRLAAGDAKACQETTQQLHAQTRLLSNSSLVVAAATIGLVARPGCGVGVSAVATPALLEQEQRRVGAVLLRAAALVADPGLPAAELVQLGQQGVQAEPQGWRSRELLGAALYRAGRDIEAVRELDEAVRLHGKASLWAKLFLALAHQRQGHAEQVKVLRQQTLTANGWEEQLIQAQLLREVHAGAIPAGELSLDRIASHGPAPRHQARGVQRLNAGFLVAESTLR
jgi:hypothetical protein